MVDSHCVMVVGPGRCGTSMVSEILIKLGVNMGTHLNQFFEDEEFKEANQCRLETLTSEVDHRLPWSSTVCDLILDRLNLPMWGFKDPRTAHFIEDYLELIPDAMIIRMRRHDEAVVKSMMKQANWAFPVALRVRSIREMALDKGLMGRDVLTLQYEHAVGDPKRTVDEIARHIGVEPTEAAYQVIRRPEHADVSRTEGQAALRHR